MKKTITLQWTDGGECYYLGMKVDWTTFSLKEMQNLISGMVDWINTSDPNAEIFDCSNEFLATWIPRDFEEEIEEFKEWFEDYFEIKIKKEKGNK